MRSRGGEREARGAGSGRARVLGGDGLMTETIGFRVTAARRTRFERVTRRTMYFLRPRTYLPHRGCLYRRSTITVTLFIILLDTTTPFSGFTISARRRRAERPRVRWREGTCARLRRARECVSRRARASRRSRLGTRARLSSTGGCAATLVDARIPPSHHPPARGEKAGAKLMRRNPARAANRRRPARDRYLYTVPSSVPQSTRLRTTSALAL